MFFSENGFGFSPNEYNRVLIIDEDGNSRDNVNQAYKDWIKGRNVYYLVGIDIEEIAKNILKK